MLPVLFVAAAPYCPEKKCSDFLTPATWTAKVAILVTGFIRTATHTQRSLHAIQALNAPAVSVDVFYHVWYNRSAACDVAAVKDLSRFARVTVEPSECAWSWGPKNFHNHWHGVYNAFRSLRHFGKHDYALIMRTGTDVRHQPSYFNFSRLWNAYSRDDGLGNFLTLGYANGFDRAAIGTPALLRAYSLYAKDDGYGCDSMFDSFPFQRMKRYGVTPPVDADNLPRFLKPPDAPFRCAPLYVKDGGEFRGSLLRPAPNVGCREHAMSSRRRLDQRELAIRPPPAFVKADHSFCALHQFDDPFNLSSGRR